MLNEKYEAGSFVAMKEGILWREKLDYGKLIINFLSFWIVLQFVIQVFYHPGFVIAFGCIYALVIGFKSGGNEVSDGAEEFSFALSVPRSVRYKCKFLYGLKPLLLILIASLLAIYFNLPQKFWGLFVETGLNNPYSEKKVEAFWYILAFFIPLALYSTVFSFTISTYGRAYLNRSVFSAIILCGLVVIGIVILYHNVDIKITNSLSVILLLLLSILSINVTFKTYCFKEGVSISRPQGTAASKALTIVIVAIIIILFLFISWGTMAPVKVSPSETVPEHSSPQSISIPIDGEIK